MSSSPDGVLLACEVAVLRALVVSGKTIRNRYRPREQRGRYQGVPADRLYRALRPGPLPEELARLTSMDRWSALMVVLAPTVGTPTALLLTAVCDDYVTVLLRDQAPHSRGRLAAHLARAGHHVAAE